MYIIGSAISLLLMALLISGSESEELSLIKRNLGDKVRYLGMDKSKTKYVFAMPFGEKVDVGKLEALLSGFLGKHVECEFNRYLYVEVNDGEIPTKLAFPNVQKTNKNVVIGMGRKGFVRHNFMTYPHMIVAGHTGYGKTNFINSLISQLDGDIAIIDMKDGDDYEQVTARNLSETVEYFEDLEANFKMPRKRHLYVIVDEAAQFVPPSYIPKKEAGDYYYCQRILHDISTLGRSRRLHLILATQYPTADVVPGHIKQNCETRVVFRLPTEVGSRVALDEEGAEKLPAGLPGRALYKNDKLIELQTFEAPKGGATIVEVGDTETTRERNIVELG